MNISADAGKGYGIFEDLQGYKDGASLSNYLKAQCQKNHGSAIDTFLTCLVKEDKAKILKKINEIAQNFLTRIKGNDTHGQVKRVVERFALVAAAGELTIEWSIVEWERGDCIEAAFTCFESWINDHREGGMSSSEEEKIVEQVRHFFESQSSRFDTFIAQSSFKGNRAGFRNEAQQGNAAGDYFVFTTTFKKEICKNYEPRLVANILNKRGLLYLSKKGKDMSISIRVQSANNKQYRLYHFPSRIVEAKSDEEKQE